MGWGQRMKIKHPKIPDDVMFQVPAGVIESVPPGDLVYYRRQPPLATTYTEFLHALLPPQPSSWPADVYAEVIDLMGPDEPEPPASDWQPEIKFGSTIMLDDEGAEVLWGNFPIPTDDPDPLPDPPTTPFDAS